MKRTLGIYLLSMLGPATAIAVFVLVERIRKNGADDMRELTDDVVAQPKFKLIAKRKR